VVHEACVMFKRWTGKERIIAKPGLCCHLVDTMRCHVVLTHTEAWAPQSNLYVDRICSWVHKFSPPLEILIFIM